MAESIVKEQAPALFSHAVAKPGTVVVISGNAEATFPAVLGPERLFDLAARAISAFHAYSLLLGLSRHITN